MRTAKEIKRTLSEKYGYDFDSDYWNDDLKTIIDDVIAVVNESQPSPTVTDEEIEVSAVISSEHHYRGTSEYTLTRRKMYQRAFINGFKTAQSRLSQPVSREEDYCSCGVPNELHGTACGWVNASVYLEPKTELQAEWLRKWKDANPSISVSRYQPVTGYSEEELEKKCEWKKYPDEKPSEYGKYWVWRKTRDKPMLETWNNLSWAYHNNQITHWMPLPTKPKNWWLLLIRLASAIKEWVRLIIK